MKVVSDSLRSHGLYSPWNFLAQNTGVDSLSLLQGFFPTQGSNPDLPRCRQILYQLSHKGSPNPMRPPPNLLPCCRSCWQDLPRVAGITRVQERSSPRRLWYAGDILTAHKIQLVNLQEFCKQVVKLLVIWNQPQWERLHRGNGQMLKTQALGLFVLFFPL